MTYVDYGMARPFTLTSDMMSVLKRKGAGHPIINTVQANVATAKTTPPSHATETAGLETLKYITKIY